MATQPVGENTGATAGQHIDPDTGSASINTVAYWRLRRNANRAWRPGIDSMVSKAIAAAATQTVRLPGETTAAVLIA